MTGFRFSLQPALDLATIEVARLEKDLRRSVAATTAAATECSVAERKFEGAREQLDSWAAAARRCPDQPQSTGAYLDLVARLSGVKDHVDLLHLHLQQLRNVREGVQQCCANLQEALVTGRQRLCRLERLRDDRAREYREECQRQEEDERSEDASISWVHRNHGLEARSK